MLDEIAKAKYYRFLSEKKMVMDSTKVWHTVNHLQIPSLIQANKQTDTQQVKKTIGNWDFDEFYMQSSYFF